VKKHFRPELLNRLDEVVVFKKLGDDDMVKVVELELMGVIDRLNAKGISVEVTEKAKKDLAERGFDPEYGARPLKRLIQREIQDTLAMEILKGNVKDGTKVLVDVDGEKGFLKFEVEK